MHLVVLSMIDQAQRIHNSHSTKKYVCDKRYSYDNSQLFLHKTLAIYNESLGTRHKVHAINYSSTSNLQQRTELTTFRSIRFNIAACHFKLQARLINGQITVLLTSKAVSNDTKKRVVQK